MGEYNTILSAYTLYRPLGQYCTHPLIYHEPCVVKRKPNAFAENIDPGQPVNQGTSLPHDLISC